MSTKKVLKGTYADGFITCTEHGRTKAVKSGKGHTCRQCKNEYQRAKHAENKQRAVALLGGKCHKCGYDTCTAALEFHHIDPSEKDFNITGQLRRWSDIARELRKCILLCANCHREYHSGLWEVSDVRNNG